MPRIPIVSAKTFIRALGKYGCVLISIRGSHHKIHYPKTNKTTILVIHASKDLDKGSFSGTLNQLGIDIDDFLAKM